MKKIMLSPWTALLTLVVVLCLKITSPSFVESVKLRYFDTLITSKPHTMNNIYTVNIDEASLDKWGQWPFDRHVFAQLIENLYQRNAGLVVWTVLMSEHDRLGGDAALAKTLAEFPVILSNVPGKTDKNTPRNPGAAIVNSQYLDQMVSMPGIIANIADLEQAAAGTGISNTLPEIDGVNRRLPLVVSRQGKLYPSVSLETLRVAAGDTNFQIKLNENGVEKLRVPQFGVINTDSLSRIWIDWSQVGHAVSAVNLPDDFGGSVVIVGVSAAGLANPVPTAQGAVWPQDVQAAVISTLANQINIERPDYAEGVEVVVLFLAGIAIIALSYRLFTGIAALLTLCVASVAGSYWLYQTHHELWDITLLVVGLVLVGLHAYILKFLTEFFAKQRIKKQFEHYLAPAMVKKLQKNPQLLKLGGDTRELTLLFCDIRGFTPISEQYKTDPQGLTSLINRFLTPMTDIIMKNEGTIDKYMGDCIMAFWNAPMDVEKQQNKAVASAMQMLEHLKGLNEELAQDNLLPINIGIGLNTGEVVVGNMGSNQRFDYSCLGDAVNLAARLEGQSKDYGVKIILGHNTASNLDASWVVVELDTIAVKGKTEGVKIYTVLGYYNMDMPEGIKKAQSAHKKFLAAYQEQRFDMALKIAHSLSLAWDYKLKDYYAMMTDRIRYLQQDPPGANWDGVYRPKTK